MAYARRRRGGGIVRLRLTSNEEDVANGFNREEHLRVIGPSGPDYQPIMDRRNDAESGHRKLDDSMTREWAHSIGRPGVLFDALMWAMFHNAQTRVMYGSRAGPAATAA